MKRNCGNRAMLMSAIFIISATLQTLSGQPVAKSRKLSKTKYYNTISTFPQFQERTSFVRDVGITIGKWARKDQTRFVNECKKTFESLGQPIAPFEYKSDYVVMYLDAGQLVSVKYEVYEYTGGAHGNVTFVVFNFGRAGRKAKQLTLGDFFSNDTTYRKRISDAVLAKLRQDDRATSVAAGEIPALTEEQISRFVVQSDGLVFLFNRYELGPYVAGTFTIKLSLDELGEAFDMAKVVTGDSDEKKKRGER